MWKLRGNLPHSVDSTAYLTEAVLHDDPTANSPSAIRAVYSTAFCRYTQLRSRLSLEEPAHAP